MDKLIKKVEKDIKNNDKKKSLKDIAILLMEDKKFDKKLDKCKKITQKKKQKK